MYKWEEFYTKAYGDESVDVLNFIENFNAKSVTLFNVFNDDYCYYFANMLKEAFERGGVYWSPYEDRIVWVDTNDVAYDVGGVCTGLTEVIPIEYLGRLVHNFRYIKTRYIPANEMLWNWCKENNVEPYQAVVALWKTLPKDLREFTVEDDVVRHFDLCLNQVFILNNKVYPIESLVRKIPVGIRSKYKTDKECILDNMEFLR